MELSSDDKTMAGLAHLSILLPQFGLIAAIVIWATQKDKSAYIRFQALQAVFYHVTFIVIWVVGMLVYLFTFFATFAFSFVPDNNGFSLAFLVIPLTFLGLFIVQFGFVGYGVFGAIRCFQGKDFRYIVIGELVSWLQRPKQPPQTIEPS